MEDVKKSQGAVLSCQSIELDSVVSPQNRLIWDNYNDSAHVGTLDGLYQHTLIATGTRLRPVEAPFLGHILGTRHAKHIGV